MKSGSQIEVMEPSLIDGDTPTLRLFALLEAVAQKDQFFSLQSMVEETGLPKPTLHRMLQQLESAGILQRDGDGRHYSTGLRLRRLAETLLLNNTVHGARHMVLRRLVDEVGESCNITALSGSEVLYLDRVETPAPLRFYLQPGSRVPVHCSASGKLFLAQMSPSQRRRLLEQIPLERYTERTITLFASSRKLIRFGAKASHSMMKSFFPVWCALRSWSKTLVAVVRTPLLPCRHQSSGYHATNFSNHFLPFNKPLLHLKKLRLKPSVSI